MADPNQQNNNSGGKNNQNNKAAPGLAITGSVSPQNLDKKTLSGTFVLLGVAALAVLGIAHLDKPVKRILFGIKPEDDQPAAIGTNDIMNALSNGSISDGEKKGILIRTLKGLDEGTRNTVLNAVQPKQAD